MRLGRVIIDADVRGLGMGDYGVWQVRAPHPLLAPHGKPVTAPPRSTWSSAALPAYRRVLATLGYPSVIPTGERTQAGVAQRGFPTYGAIVDIATVLTLEFGGGVGLHRLTDADDHADVEVHRSRGDARMRPAFSSKARPIPAGDIVYGLRTTAGFEPLAWLGKRDCDSAERQILPETRSAVIVIQDAIDLPAGHRARQDERLAELIDTYLPHAELEAVSTG